MPSLRDGRHPCSEGYLGWPACDENQVIGRHRQSRNHRMSVPTGKLRHCGDDLPRDPSAQGRGQVAHVVLWDNPFAHNPRTSRKLRNLIEKSRSRRPGATNVLWLSGTNRHAPVPVRLYFKLSRLIKSFPLAVTPVSQAAALTAEAANGSVTHMSATIGRPGSSGSKSPRSGSRRERGGTCCAAAWPHAARGISTV